MMEIYNLKSYKDEEIYKILDEDVARWFKSTYKTFTPPQKYSIIPISEKKNVLISSPTGSGKTLSAFLAIIDELVKLSKQDKLENKTYALYISPLRALNNDMQKNLNVILEGIEKYYPNHGINVGLRTGDTTSYERKKLLENPPHILVTTPESFAIMLSTKKTRKNLENVDWVIVDEIHALADNKRGVLLSLNLERLAYKKEFARIGLSATISPLEEVARFLVGDRECGIADVSYSKKYDIKSKTLISDFINVEEQTVMQNLMSYLIQEISKNRTILVFTNTRALAESLAFSIKLRFPEIADSIEVHHSSLSREQRFSVENRMKEGKIKAVFSSTSLELGIDIGYIDKVILINSPKGVARALQRIGRAGHKLSEISVGELVSVDIDNYIENCIIVKSIKHRKIDKVKIPKNNLDVLSQALIGMCFDEIDKEQAFQITKRSYCYRDISRQEFEEVYKFLSSDPIVFPKISEDMAPRISSKDYLMNIGTIPTEINVSVYAKKDEKWTMIGSLDEDYASELRKGDVFVLSGKTYKVIAIDSLGNVYVEYTPDLEPNIPSWFSEVLPLSYETALDIEKFRQVAINMSEEEIAEYLEIEDASQIKQYIDAQVRYLGKENYPTSTNLLIEKWKDKYVNYGIHILAGRKVTSVFSTVFRQYLSKHVYYISTLDSDYGIVIRTDREVDDHIIDVFRLSEDEFISSLKKGISSDASQARFPIKFKNVAVRAYAIIYPKDKRVRLPFIARKILNEIDENHPLYRETVNEIINIDMSLQDALDYLKKLKQRRIAFVSSTRPSPFSVNLVYNSNTIDYAVNKEKRKSLKELLKI